MDGMIIGTLEELKVQPGDVVKWTDTSRERTIAGWKDGKCFATDQKLGGWESMRTDCKWTLVSRAKPASPVRTVTRKEIVPGVYGRIDIIGGPYKDGHVCLDLVDGDGDRDGSGIAYYLSATELRAAIATLTEIAQALEEQA